MTDKAWIRPITTDKEAEMADKDKSGIEMLRKLAEDVYDDWSLWSILKCGKKAEWGGDDGWPKISDALRSIADQIEREHAEELAAAKRGLTDEARVAVERLRAVSHDEVLKSANPDFDIVNELCAAVGVSRLRTYTGTLDALGERIAELKESVAAWCPASWLTHTPPDTQALIDDDKGKMFDVYWGCRTAVNCLDCPAVVDGKHPDERYGVVSCEVAQGMDIARRQRELDAKTTGGER